MAYCGQSTRQCVQSLLHKKILCNLSPEIKNNTLSVRCKEIKVKTVYHQVTSTWNLHLVA